MSRPIINLLWQGRAGNTLFQAAHALAYAERHGCELRSGPWWGFSVFCLDYNPIREELPRRNEVTLIDGETNVELQGYWQNRRSVIYTRDQVRRWFRFRPHVEAALQGIAPGAEVIAAHLRRGDYLGYGYPLVSQESYFRACQEYGLDSSKLLWVSEECPVVTNEFHGELGFLPDFFIMSKARVLLRANSSFSFWAGAIGTGRVFSPVIDGLKGGQEHDVRFIEGNHARIADFDFVDPIVIGP